MTVSMPEGVERALLRRGGKASALEGRGASTLGRGVGFAEEGAVPLGGGGVGAPEGREGMGAGAGDGPGSGKEVVSVIFAAVWAGCGGDGRGEGGRTLATWEVVGGFCLASAEVDVVARW